MLTVIQYYFIIVQIHAVYEGTQEVTGEGRKLHSDQLYYEVFVLFTKLLRLSPYGG